MKAVKVAESTMFALNFLKFGAPTLTGIILIICVVINPMNKTKLLL